MLDPIYVVAGRKGWVLELLMVVWIHLNPPMATVRGARNSDQVASLAPSSSFVIPLPGLLFSTCDVPYACHFLRV